MRLEDAVFLVIVRLGEGLIDVDGAGRSGRPSTYKEVLYGKGGHDLIAPGCEACSFRHDGGGRERRKVDAAGAGGR